MGRFFTYDEVQKIKPTTQKVTETRDRVLDYMHRKSLLEIILMYGSTIWDLHPKCLIQHNARSDIDILFNDNEVSNPEIIEQTKKDLKQIEEETGINIDFSRLTENVGEDIETEITPFYIDNFRILAEEFGYVAYEKVLRYLEPFFQDIPFIKQQNALYSFLSQIKSISNKFDLWDRDNFEINKVNLDLLSHIESLPGKYALYAFGMDNRRTVPYTKKHALELFLQEPAEVDKRLLIGFGRIKEQSDTYQELITKVQDGMTKKEYDSRLKEIVSDILFNNHMMLNKMAKSYDFGKKRLNHVNMFDDGFHRFWASNPFGY